MAVKTLFLTNSLAGTAQQELSETAPGAIAVTSPNTGWTVAKTAAGNYSHLDAQTEAGSGTFNATVKPGVTVVTTAAAGNALRSTGPLAGFFATGDWTLRCYLRSVTAAATGSMRIRARAYRCTGADGSGATDISGGADAVGTQVSALSTTVSVVSTVTLSVSGFPLQFNNEYLLVTIALEIDSASGNNSADALLVVGPDTSSGTSLVTTEFTPALIVPPRTTLQALAQGASW